MKDYMRPIKNKTEHMQYMDGYQNGYKNALSEVDNTSFQKEMIVIVLIPAPLFRLLKGS